MIGSTFTLKGKTYRNLEAQVLENQKKSIKNEQDIVELAKKDEIKRVLDCEMSGDEFIGDNKTLPAYGATTLTEYFQKVGYLVAQLDMGDNQFMFAISRNTTDDGFINFDFGLPSDDATERIYRASYMFEIDAETDTVNFYFDDFYGYHPYNIDLLQPFTISGAIVDGQTITLPYTGNELANHLNFTIRWQQNIEFCYMLRIYSYYNNGSKVQIHMDASSYAYDGGSALYLTGYGSSNIFTVETVAEV